MRLGYRSRLALIRVNRVMKHDPYFLVMQSKGAIGATRLQIDWTRHMLSVSQERLGLSRVKLSQPAGYAPDGSVPRRAANSN